MPQHALLPQNQTNNNNKIIHLFKHFKQQKLQKLQKKVEKKERSLTVALPYNNSFQKNYGRK